MTDINKPKDDFGLDIGDDSLDLGSIFGGDPLQEFNDNGLDDLSEDFSGDFNLDGDVNFETGEIDLGGDDDLFPIEPESLQGDPLDSDVGELDLDVGEIPGGDDSLPGGLVEDGVLVALPDGLLETVELEGIDIEDDIDALLDEEEREANRDLLQEAVDKRLKSRRSKGAKEKALEKVLASNTKFYDNYQAYFNAIEPVSFCARTEDSIKSCGIQFTDPFLEEKAYLIVDVFSKSLPKYIRAGREFDAKTMVDTHPAIAISGLEEDRGYTLKDKINDTENYNALVDLLTIIERSIRETEDTFKKNQRNKKSLEQTNLDTFFPFVKDISTMRDGILDLAENDPEALLEETTFVEKIDLTNDTYVCGFCGKENETKIPFYTNIFFPIDSGDKVSVSSVFGMNRCEECESINLMSIEEMDGLRIVHENGKTEYYRSLEQFHLTRSALGNRTEDFGFTKYRASDNAVKNRLPGLFETTEMQMEIEEDSYDPGELSQAIERYLGLLKFFKSRATTSNIVESVASDKQEETILKLDTVVFEEVPSSTGDASKTVIRINSGLTDEAYKYETLAKLLCTILNRDYNSIKQNAINSLVSHLGSARLSKYLRYSNHVQLQCAKLTGPLIKDLGNTEGDLLLGNATDILSSFMLDEPINLVGLEKPHILSIVREEYGKLDARIEEYKTKRLQVLTDLKKNIDSYSYLTISSIRIDEEIYLDLMQDPDIRFLVDVITNRMIITFLCEDFFYTWFPPMSDSHAREIRNMASNRGDIVQAVERVLTTKIDESLRGRFKTSKVKTDNGVRVVEKIVEGLYTDPITVSVLEHVLKLQSDIVVDEYRAILTLQEILDNRDSLVFKEIEALLEFKPEIDEIVNRCGKGDLGRLKYYLKPLGFSDAEIEGCYNANLNNLQFQRIITREGNETLESYLQKYREAEGAYVRNAGDKDRLKAYLISIGFEVKDVDEYVDSNWDKYKTLDLNLQIKRSGESHPSSYLQRYMEVQYKVEKENTDNWSRFEYTRYKPKFLMKLMDCGVALDAIFVKANATVESELMHNPNTFFGMLTTLNTICRWCNTREMLTILEYDEELVNGLINNIPKKNFYGQKFDSFREDSRILSYVYDNPMVNSAISESDSMESKISRLLHYYKDDLMDYTEYLPTEDRKFIDNFRYSRSFDPGKIEEI